MGAGTNNTIHFIHYTSLSEKLHTLLHYSISSSFMIAILVSECGQSEGQHDDDQGGREVPQRASRHHQHHAKFQRQ